MPRCRLAFTLARGVTGHAEAKRPQDAYKSTNALGKPGTSNKITPRLTYNRLGIINGNLLAETASKRGSAYSTTVPTFSGTLSTDCEAVQQGMLNEVNHFSKTASRARNKPIDVSH